MTTTEILIFYGWWQFSVCLFAFAGLMTIWWHIGRKQNDFGQVWLAVSILCWSFSGLGEVLLDSELATSQDQHLLGGCRSIFSLLNSLFILLALPWFRYIPSKIESLIKSDYWQWIVGLPFLFSLIPTIRWSLTGGGNDFIRELDVYYAFFTLPFLGAILWQSFSKRRLVGLAYLSILVILLAVFAQICKITDYTKYLVIFSAIFKTNLIMIFFALALSWVKELSESNQVIPGRIFLRFDPQQMNKAKAPVWIKGLHTSEFTKIILTRKKHELLYKFATQKKHQPEAAYLTIKPQGEKRTSKIYDIQEHNEYIRIVESLLNISYGKSNWTKELHEKPLLKALFHKPGDRTIGLNIPVENIILDYQEETKI